MFALGPEQKAVQSLVLPHRANTVEPTRKHFVDVALVADVEDKPVLGSFEDAVQGDGQLYDSEVGTKVAAGLRQDFYQFIAHFLCELRQILLAQSFYVRRRMDPVEQPWGIRGFRRV
jgi:hypothetical protein